MFLLEVFLASATSASLCGASNSNTWENFIAGRGPICTPQPHSGKDRLASHAASDAENLIDFIRKLENGESYLTGRGIVFQATSSTNKSVTLASKGDRPLIVVLSREDGSKFTNPQQDRLNVLIDKYFLA